MTTFAIQDTGEYRVGEGVPVGEKRAYGTDGVAGTPLELKGTKITFTGELMTDGKDVPYKLKDNSSVESFEMGEVATQGVSSPLWVLRGVFKSSNTSDMKTLGRLIYMSKTKGVKKLIPPLDTVRTDILSYSKYGENEAASETEVIDFISVRVKLLNIESDANRTTYKYTLTLLETV